VCTSRSNKKGAGIQSNGILAGNSDGTSKRFDAAGAGGNTSKSRRRCDRNGMHAAAAVDQKQISIVVINCNTAEL